MSLRPQEIARSEEMESSLEGPANSLTDESIDCGCGRYQLPKLARFATRRVFLALLCCIGVLQAAAQTYLHVVASTIARRFEIDPNAMEWILYTSEIALLVAGLTIAYWGDRIHRAAWLGGTVLVQSAGLLALVIPHISHSVKIIEQREIEDRNITHMSIYAEEHPDLCIESLSRIMMPQTLPQVSAMVILIIVQMITAAANVAYCALGLSYLDDNSKTEQAPVYLAIVVAVKALGSVLGYMMGWGFLRIDADNLSSIQSYRDQLGAWWLGWPIFAVLLVAPGIFMSIFSRKLPSKLVEETAAEILDQSGTLRGSQRFTVKKVGSIEFFPSMFRLISNKILIFNIVSAAFFFAALANFLSKENVFLETKFYAPRPNGILMGFGDPIVSRVIMAIMKPVLIGLAIVISGLVIARSKPQAKWLVCYTMAVIAVAAVIVFGFAFSGCTKVEIVSDPNVKVFDPLIFCNRNCHCSKDADFRPVCDSTGKYMYYSPCHAGCSSMRNDLNTRVYSNCSCAYEMTTIVQDQETIIDLSTFEVSEGACQLGSCQVGWILYEIFMALVYTAAGSTIIGDLLINLRTVNAQDKALTIGYAMALISFFAFVPIKILYDELTNLTCVHWGHDQRVCHLHDSTTLGYYLCFLTSGLLVIGNLFKIGTWAFLENLELYEDEIDEPTATEMQVFSSPQEEPLLEADQAPEEPEQSNDNDNPSGNADVPDNSFKPVSILKKPDSSKGNGPIVEFQDIPQSSYSQVQIREEPVAAQDAASESTNFLSDVEQDAESSDDSPVMSKAPGPQVPYRPLDLDSDADSNCNDESAKKFVPVEDGHYYTNMRFPDPSDYEVPKKFKPRSSVGNFNEVGIPVVESYEPQESSACVKSPTIMEAHIKHLQRNPSQELLDEARSIYKSSLKVDISESEDIPENHFRPIEVPPSSLLRPQSRDQASSGFGSLQDIRDKAKSPVVAPALSQESFCSIPPVTNNELSFGSPLCTDL
ncbi:solute carrier organic anion transporter family member 2A1-like [Trichogramma pretiosum]|uniref:solute carrier organic anion transporter family member 2A1-like n=1 Tax=Trichogramma pretiosum TaxID=7493 RepID=UPI0006C94F1B|nr:solute carrier organic anion transporter family member 2A1-like [Trichogramma pretiosum]